MVPRAQGQVPGKSRRKTLILTVYIVLLFSPVLLLHYIDLGIAEVRNVSSCESISHLGLRPALSPCPTRLCSGGARSCWSFTGSCDAKKIINVPSSCPHVGNAVTVVTAFLPVRGDRAQETWTEWVTKTAEIPSDVVAWLPSDDDNLVVSFLEKRKTRRSQYNTCVLLITQMQLPYVYLLPRIKDKLIGKSPYVPDESWNKDSVELTTPAYLPVQFSKVPFLFGTSQIFGGDWFVWIDAGLSRHIDDFGNDPWPSDESITSLPTSSVYVSSWNGYGEATDAWKSWCNNPAESFKKNRNLLAGGVMFATKHSLARFLPVWTSIFEKMSMPGSPWNNEQVVLSLIGCALPDLLGVLDTRSMPVLWRTMQARKAIANISRLPAGDSALSALCAPWIGLP